MLKALPGRVGLALNWQMHPARPYLARAMRRQSLQPSAASIKSRFSTAAPAAPLPRLSNTAANNT